MSFCHGRDKSKRKHREPFQGSQESGKSLAFGPLFHAEFGIDQQPVLNLAILISNVH
jgi:hypothetical protein